MSARDGDSTSKHPGRRQMSALRAGDGGIEDVDGGRRGDGGRSDGRQGNGRRSDGRHGNGMRGGGAHPRWMAWTLYAAGAYNLAWGAFVVLFPLAFFRWAGAAPPNYPQIWQCLGMVVGVYGVGYAIAARDPFRHWPIIFVGLLGKLLGPVGFLQTAARGDWPWALGWLNVTNDLIWLVPFALILRGAYVDWRERARVVA